MKWASGSLWQMTNQAQVITMIGAGGKTTCLQALAYEISAAGHSVIATTTTKVYTEEHMQAWCHPGPPPYQHDGVYFWYTKVDEGSGKWLGPSPTTVDQAIQRDFQRQALDLKEKIFYRYWIIEGDGARERRLKCWAQHEPQIPHLSKCAVLVVDGSLWGYELKSEYVHRPERCGHLVNNLFAEDSAWDYFLNSPVFWKQYRELSWIVLLNIPKRIVSISDYPAEDSEDQYKYCYSDPLVILEALYRRGAELQVKDLDLGSRPRSLRLAAGDAKEGRLQWFDLW
jgi:probable selenium-dependent hydroxylase accessory protein YqeC